jgi:NAD(P)-dependent dehydrogenase (short-subunit alcohol dehydrogenase family)
MQFAGKVVLVTGAQQGIGRAVAVGFVHYVASKDGLLSLTRTMALELAP